MLNDDLQHGEGFERGNWSYRGFLDQLMGGVSGLLDRTFGREEGASHSHSGSSSDLFSWLEHDGHASEGHGDHEGHAGHDANVIRGTAEADTLTGTAGNDRIYGEEGADVISGLEGNDRLDGGLGADSMTGGAGDDRYYVNDAGDQVIESADGGHDIVYSTISYTLGANVEDLRLKGMEDINGTGTDGDNFIFGNYGANLLSGLGGSDVIDGDRGNDMLLGGAGDDRLIGGRGDDVLVGGAGTDDLTGGHGADTFVFTAVGDSAVGDARDEIHGFSTARDLLDLSQIDANSGVGGDQAFSFIGNGAFSGVAGEFRYDPSTNIAAGDTNGDGVADFEIKIHAYGTFSAADVIL